MNKKKLLLIILVLLVAFLVRLFPIRIAHWWDETVYLQNAEVLFSGRTNYNEFSFRPPLLSILFFLGFFIWHSPILASILTAAISVLAPLFIFLIGKKLYGFMTGAIAGLITAFSPFIILNSNFLLTDIPVVSLMAISFYLVLFNDRKLFLFLSGIFFSLAILMKFTAVLLALIFLFYFFIKKFNFKKILLFSFGAFLIIFPYLLWAQIQFGNFLLPFIKGASMVSVKNESTLFYFLNISRAFTILVPIGLILWFVFSLIQIKNKKYVNIWKDLIMLFWIVLFLAYLTYTPHKELRYIFPITIPITILASQGIFLFFSKFKKQYKYLLIVLFAIFMLINVVPRLIYIGNLGLIDYTETDEMKASFYIKDQMNYDGIIYSNHNWPVFAYYSGAKTILIWPNDERFYQVAKEIMKYPGLLIIEKGIQKHPTTEWLDENPKFNFIKRQGNIFIYKYSPVY